MRTACRVVRSGCVWGGVFERIPTLFVFEAVLFYVEEDAIRNIMGDLSSFMGSWRERGAEALLCMTGSYFLE